jgi:hypothetical protein
MARQKYWGVVYDERVNKGEVNDRDEDHRLAREHLARQSSIEEDLLEALRANVCTSYRNLYGTSMVGAPEVLLNTCVHIQCILARTVCA